MAGQPLTVAQIDSLEAVSAPAWNALIRDGNPFLTHEFLAALERHGCVGARWGWFPEHLIVLERRAEGDVLVGATPRYRKTNSYGELVFDHAWADAYHRHGLPYFPKQVIAVPYTPATGQRLLAEDTPSGREAVQALIDHALTDARAQAVSSQHWLFVNEEDRRNLESRGLFSRVGCQFHWHNRGWPDFAAFLESLASKKRKNIRRERRLVREAGVELDLRHGGEMSDRDWAVFYGFYRATFARKGGYPTLSLGFFREIGRTLPEQVIVVSARRRGETIAGSLMFRGEDALYGRHWGALESVDGLHFEACYYQGLEYCLRHGLRRFEPGAQGEFKISRGFLPQKTWSCHWLAHPKFHAAIERHNAHEGEWVDEYMQDLGEHSPYKRSDAASP